MEKNKKLMDNSIKITRERDYAEKQLITKTQSFADMQMENEKTRRALMAEQKKLSEEKKTIAEEQKKLKKLLSKNNKIQRTLRR
jgi:septal ring factor EnvC (AmiA/AmiB activator)